MGLTPDLRCLPPVERMTPGISSWTCHKFPMPRYMWSQAPRTNCGRIVGIDPLTFDPARSTSRHRRSTWPALCYQTSPGFLKPISPAYWNRQKKQVADLERISGAITPDGIALTCIGKGGKASGRLVLNPDQSGDLKAMLHHSVEDFHLELPGPSWLAGLLVSRDAIETSIRNGLRNLAREIDARLRLRAIALFTEQVQTTDPDLGVRLAGTAPLTMERLRYPVVARQTEASGVDRAIGGDVCLGFLQSFQGTGQQETA